MEVKMKKLFLLLLLFFLVPGKVFGMYQVTVDDVLELAKSLSAKKANVDGQFSVEKLDEENILITIDNQAIKNSYYISSFRVQKHQDQSITLVALATVGNRSMQIKGPAPGRDQQPSQLYSNLQTIFNIATGLPKQTE